LRWHGVKAGAGRATAQARQFAGLDAAAFYAGRLAAPDGPPPDPDAVRAAAGALRRLGVGLACPFYVIVRADIDNLGSLIDDRDERLSALKARAVARFGRRTRRVLETLGALVVYSGGDDLLAFAPARSGLAAAAAVRRQAAFVAARLGDEGIEYFTVSVAVLFAHLKTPLAAMLEASRRLLEDEAKEAAGRDSVAIEVHKRGGKPLRWRRPWERAMADRRRGRLQLAELADKAPFSSGFLHRLAPMLAGNVDGMGPDVVKDIAWALYLRSPLEDDSIGPALGRDATDALVDQCRNRRRLTPSGERAAHFEFTDRYEPDAALIVRFVAELDSAAGDD
jgi:CRISPR-associated protein Cmr2